MCTSLITWFQLQHAQCARHAPLLSCLWLTPGRFRTRTRQTVFLGAVWARGSPMDVEEFVPSVEQYAYTFGGASPVRRVRPGTALRLWSDDAFGGALRSVADLSREKVDIS